MSKLELPKKIRTEDFSDEERPLVEKIGYVYNTFVEQLYFLLNKNIDNDNLNRDTVTVEVHIDGSGNISNDVKARYKTRNNQIKGIHVIKHESLDTPATNPTGYPYPTFSYNTGILTITNITNLQNNSKYRLTIEIIG